MLDEKSGSFSAAGQAPFSPSSPTFGTAARSSRRRLITLIACIPFALALYVLRPDGLFESSSANPVFRSPRAKSRSPALATIQTVSQAHFSLADEIPQTQVLSHVPGFTVSNLRFLHRGVADRFRPVSRVLDGTCSGQCYAQRGAERHCNE